MKSAILPEYEIHVVHTSFAMTQDECAQSYASQHLECAMYCFTVQQADAVMRLILEKGSTLRKALARATRCFSPPLSLSPRSPTTVSYLQCISSQSCNLADP